MKKETLPAHHFLMSFTKDSKELIPVQKQCYKVSQLKKEKDTQSLC